MKKYNYLLLILIILLSKSTLICEWKQIETIDFGDVQAINCPDSNNCFALVNHPSTPVLYKSTDQGKSWQLIYEDNRTINPAVEKGIAPNPNYYFIADYYYSRIEKSTDGGLTFREIVLDNSHFGPRYTMRDFAMYDTNYGFVANGWHYFTTTDGWETFERHPKLDNSQTYYSPIFMDSNIIVMTSYATPPLDTHNHMAFVKYYMNENKWDTLFYFGAEFKKWLNAVEYLYFVNDSLGFGCGHGVDFDLPSGNYYDIIYKTTDGGNNWELIYKELVHPEKGFFNISFADEKNGVAVGYWGKIAMTNDGGDTWVYEPIPNDMYQCRKMLVCWAGQTPLIGTWDAGIFRYEGDFFDFPIGVKEILHSTNINIRQAPEKLLISIEDEHFRKYKLQICDIMGNIVKEQELQSGIGTLYMPVDISGLTNGAYLYMISTGGVVAKTGKFIVITNY